MYFFKSSTVVNGHRVWCSLTVCYFACCSQIQLRPNAYYKLTDGCELVFADVKCWYFYGAPAEHLGSGDVDQTQSYEFEEVGGEGGGAQEGQADGGEGRGGGGGEEVDGGGGGGREATEYPAAGSVEDSEVMRVRKRGGGRLESDSSAEQSEPTGDKETVKEEGTNDSM